MEDHNAIITNLHQLLDYDVRKFSSSDIQLKNNLPKWIANASTLKLKTVLQKYLDFVQDLVEKLNVFFEAEEINSLSFTNRVMKAFIDETEEKLSNCSDIEVKDACLLAIIQAINHFKITTYGTAAAFANALNLGKYATVFHNAEMEEKQIDDRLSRLAEKRSTLKQNLLLP